MDLEKGDTRLIISVASEADVLRNQLAYILATAKWETAHTMKPVRETLADSDNAAKARLEAAWARGQLPWVTKPYWRNNYFGRGYVQLTHDYNYRRASDELGADLLGNPSLALDPEIAAQVLVKGCMEGWFTGKKLPDYITLQQSDFVNARRVINGTDKAKQIAKIAKEYDAALKAEGYGDMPRADWAPPAPPADEVPRSPWASIIAAILSIFGRKQ